MDLSELSGEATGRHPWELSRGRFFATALRQGGFCDRPLSVLDVGSGDAWLARTLLSTMHPQTTITCVDVGYGDRTDAPSEGSRMRFVREIPAERFDLVLLLDVLEHIRDDVGALRAVVDDHLQSDGHALVSVPAWRRLFSEHDTRLRHFRRYDPTDAERLIEGAGLRIIRRGGLFHSLLVPRIVQ
jgi:2-polyprenyl-3-methyl-5-hydroxy-6-metoxy-1,4-benzoquinol methylase